MCTRLRGRGSSNSHGSAIKLVSPDSDMVRDGGEDESRLAANVGLTSLKFGSNEAGLSMAL